SIITDIILLNWRVLITNMTAVYWTTCRPMMNARQYNNYIGEGEEGERDPGGKRGGEPGGFLFSLFIQYILFFSFFGLTFYSANVNIKLQSNKEAFKIW